MELNSGQSTKGPELGSGKAISDWRLGRIRPTPTHVPQGWTLVPITNIARLESGHTPSRRRPEYWQGRIPWVSLHDSQALDVAEIDKTAQTIGPLGLENSSARLLPKGTVIFSRTATVGKATVLGREMATSQDFANYVCGDRLHNHFLVHLLRHLKPEWTRLMAGSTLNTIYLPVFRNLQILLPPVLEQRSIGEALGDVDTLINALDQLIAKKRYVKRATMERLLTGQHRLPGVAMTTEYKQTDVGAIPEHWGATTIRGIASPVRHAVVGGPFGSDLVSRDYVNEGVPVIRGQNMGGRWVSGEFVFVTQEKANSLKANLARAGDIVFTQRGTLGQVSLIPDAAFSRYLISQSQMKLSVDPAIADSTFFYYVFTSDRQQLLIQQNTIQTGVPHINLGILRNIPVQLPPLAEQMAIATVLSDMDVDLSALEQRRDKTCALKQGMMQELLTGSTRLV
jgi:type I restriction enzyme S subunit